MPEHEKSGSRSIFGYGLGVNIAKTKKGVAYRHGGFFPGYNSLLVYYPGHEFAIAMQNNADRTAIDGHVEAITDTVVRALSNVAARAGATR